MVTYVEDLRTTLLEGSLTEQKSFIKSFVRLASVREQEAVVQYVLPLPWGHGGENKQMGPGA